MDIGKYSQEANAQLASVLLLRTFSRRNYKCEKRAGQGRGFKFTGDWCNQ